jgi:hypothetical protein
MPLLYAKSNAVVRAKQLEKDILEDIGDGEMLCVAAAGSWMTWDDEKGVLRFVPAEEFSDKYLYVGGA